MKKILKRPLFIRHSCTSISSSSSCRRICIIFLFRYMFVAVLMLRHMCCCRVSAVGQSCQMHKKVLSQFNNFAECWCAKLEDRHINCKYSIYVLICPPPCVTLAAASCSAWKAGNGSTTTGERSKVSNGLCSQKKKATNGNDAL